MNLKRAIVGVSALAVSIALLTGCGANNMRDIEGVKSMDPDYIEIYNSTDKHPNLELVCIRGVAFVTTTRQGAGAFKLVPGWDDFCLSKASRSVQESQEGKNGNGPK